MKKTITVFFLLFTISAAAAAFRPLAIPTVYHDDRDVSNDVVLTTKSSSDLPPNDDQIATTANEAVKLPESTTQTLFVNHRSHPIRLSRSNQINRHFYNADHPRIPLRFVRRHPCRNYFHINNQNNNKLSLAEVALESDKTNPSGNDVVVTTVPSKWLEFKHEYGHHRHHHHDSELFQPKYEIDGDKLQMHHHHHHHHHQHKGVGFMRAIRKFLKHAFD